MWTLNIELIWITINIIRKSFTKYSHFIDKILLYISLDIKAFLRVYHSAVLKEVDYYV